MYRTISENILSANRVLKAGIGIGQYPNSCAPNWATQTILGALQRYRLGAVTDTRLLTMSAFRVDYPLAKRSGLWDAVEGRVLIYIHKEQMLDDMRQRYPARHYVMIDDKLRILSAMKKIWGAQLTTVFPRQGHYALDPKIVASYPPPDITIERIGDLVNYDMPAFMGQKEQQ